MRNKKRKKMKIFSISKKDEGCYREYYLPDKKARALERGCIVAKRGKVPFLREICSPKNLPPFHAPLTAH
jgi:hypothetical protein